MKKKFWAVCCTITFALMLAVSLTGCGGGNKGGSEEVSEVPENAEFATDTENSDDMSTIDIPEDTDTDKMVSLAVDSLGRANPFLPPGDVAYDALNVPQQKLQYDVLPPLETPEPDMDARRASTTKVSGIMYDKSSPSAILNIAGLDYLVRSGDVINGYKVLSIDKSVVTVQVGSNIYKAGVGQIVEDEQNGLNHNQIANLSNKFGGNK